MALLWILLYVMWFEMKPKQLKILTFRVQEFCETQVLLSDVEGLLEIVCCIGPRQLVEFYQVRSARHKMSCLYGSIPTFACRSNLLHVFPLQFFLFI